MSTNLHQNPNVSIFFDMDGVLSIFYGPIGLPNDNREYPINQLNHYFKYAKPNPQIQEFIKTLQNKQISLYLVTHTTEMDKELDLQHMYDKQVWLETHYPNVFSPEHKIVIPNQTVSKAKAVQITTGINIKKTDILIDDYNKNLTDWTDKGGTAIKFINNKNSADSFTGPHITPEMSSQDIYTLIKDSVNM